MRKVLLVVVVVLLPILVSCNFKNSDPGYVVAKVNGEKITLGDLDKAIIGQVYEAKKRMHDLRQRELDELIGQKLMETEAKKKGITVDALKKEAEKNAESVKDEEIDRFYEMVKKKKA